MVKRTSFLKKSAYTITAFLLFFCSASLIAFFVSFNDSPKYPLQNFYLEVTFFTLLQASLSTVLSTFLGAVLAWSFYINPNFFGRMFLLRLLSVPIILPSILIATSILTLYGHNGYINHFFTAFHLNAHINCYGLNGILLAHTLFNLPLAMRLFLSTLSCIPDAYQKTAAQLGLLTWNRFKYVEWPYLKLDMIKVLLFIFLMCLTSFAIILLLGGGPKTTTLEVEIYQNIGIGINGFYLAFILSFIQIGISFLILGLFIFSGKKQSQKQPIRLVAFPYIYICRSEKIISCCLIIICSIFILTPLSSLLLSGFQIHLLDFFKNFDFWSALSTSFFLSILSAFFSVCFSWILVNFQIQKKSDSQTITSSIPFYVSHIILVISPIILGGGWFLISYKFMNSLSLTLWIIVISNIFLCLPISMHILEPTLRSLYKQYNQLLDSLNFTQKQRFLLIEWPISKFSLCSAFCFSILLSFGDLTIISYFGNENLLTIPLLIQQYLSNYRHQEAEQLCTIIIFIYFIIFCIFDTNNNARKSSE